MESRIWHTNTRHSCERSTEFIVGPTPEAAWWCVSSLCYLSVRAHVQWGGCVVLQERASVLLSHWFYHFTETVPGLESEPSESTWSSNEYEYDYNDDDGEDKDAIVSFQLYSPTQFLWHMAHLLISLILVHATVQGRGRGHGKPQTNTPQASKVQGDKKPSTSSDVRSIPVL